MKLTVKTIRQTEVEIYENVISVEPQGGFLVVIMKGGDGQKVEYIPSQTVCRATSEG